MPLVRQTSVRIRCICRSAPRPNPTLLGNVKIASRPRPVKYEEFGGIAVPERFWRTLRSEGTRPLLVPYCIDRMQQELDVFIRWYNELRPHSAFGGRTPAEVHSGREHPKTAQHIEPRARYPVPAEDLDSGRVIRVQHIHLKPEHFGGRRHLLAPVLDLAA